MAQVIKLKPERKAPKPPKVKKAEPVIGKDDVEPAKPKEKEPVAQKPKKVVPANSEVLVPLLIRLPAGLVGWLDKERFVRKANTRTDLIRAILTEARGGK